MQKRKRQELIKQMIKDEKLGTQKDIQDRLERQGIYVTQTTLSRDMREIGLTKVRKDQQTYYVLAHETSKIDVIEFLSHHIRKVERTEFMLVFHTNLGEAAVLANAVDTDADRRLLGTVAGADTLLAICRDVAGAKEIEDAINERLEQIR